MLDPKLSAFGISARRIDFINNEKYNFMDFNYKSFDDFKNSVKNIEKSSEYVDKNEYEK